MRPRHCLVAACVLALCCGTALAQPPTPAAPQAPKAPAPPSATMQAPKPPAAPTPPAPPAPPIPDTRPGGQAVNIRVDVTITDQRANTTSLKKTVTVVTADNRGSRIRSTASYMGVGEIPLNVDAEPQILADGKIMLRVNLQYDLPGGTNGKTTDVPTVPSPTATLFKTQIQENLALVLESGKPIVAAQSADPVGDRQVTIEVKATILK